MSDYQTTTEIVYAAEQKLDAPVWDYITGGSETETSIARNRASIEAFALRARVLRNVVDIDTSVTLLGTRLRMPYILAPVGGMQGFSADGAAAQVRGACAFGTLPVVSSVSLPSLEESAAAAAGDKWFQLYIRGDFAWIEAIVARVRESGFKALVITVDVAIYGNRERQKLQRYVPQGRRQDLGGEGFQAALDWDLLDRIIAIAGIPVIVKGIQTSEDALLALEHGVGAVWVSNHGGRQLDHAVGSLDMLPEIVAAVAGRVPVIVDGGFMRGTDILKAIALGADAVATGRMHAWAIAAGGDAALVRMLEIIEAELRTAMGLIGATSLGQVDASFIRAAGAGAGRGAFPLIGRLASAAEPAR